MEPFGRISGIAAALPSANVDTDVIMPKQFLKGVDRSGLADGVFHDLRTDPEFVLNRAPWREARFLVVGPNFGCGSSREHAVWGLRQLGIRALLGSTFAGIFYDNCARNGLLALTLPETIVERLLVQAAAPASAGLSIDLPSQVITLADGEVIAFDIGRTQKEALVQGLDPVGATLRHREAIAAFEAEHHRRRPWLA